ncbi:MAG: nitrilase-related carbon-nitrogen hydrolase [Myxococcales bacterium]
MSVLRAALTQTLNAYPMPATREGLGALQGKLRDVARANVDHHLELLEKAVAAGARAVCFGELFVAPYFALEENPLWLGLAEDAEHGETVQRVREASARHGCVVVAPIYELDPNGRRFNTAVVVDQGRLLGKYRKIHIPDGANEQGSFHEKLYYERSDGQGGFFPVFETSAGRIGVAICYDRHFEGVVRSLAEGGAQLVFSPAVTFGEKSRRLWRLEFQVDAARHGVFIGGSNRKGREPPWNQEYFGDSHFVGPNGPLPDLSRDGRLVVADLDLEALSAPDPSGWKLRRDARPEILTPGR